MNKSTYLYKRQSYNFIAPSISVLTFHKSGANEMITDLTELLSLLHTHQYIFSVYILVRLDLNFH